MAVTTTNLGVITAYGDAVAAGYTGTKAEWQALMASYATVGQQAVDAKNDAVAAKNTAVSKATEATTAANTATTKASEASASAESIAESAAQIRENTDSIDQLKSDLNAEETRAKAEEERLEELFTAPTQEAVNNWLNDHPEATTTVLDGSLTDSKFSDALKLETIKDYVTPEMFGAVGDGVTDDTDAFKSMIADVGGTGVVRLLAKTYRLTDTLILPVGLEFSGIGVSSVIKVDHNKNAFNLTDGYSGNYIHDFTITGGSDSTYCFNVARPQCIFERLYFPNYNGDGFNITNGSVTGGYATWFKSVKFVGVKDTAFVRKYGVTINVNGGIIIFDSCIFSLCSRAIFISNGDGIFIKNSNISECNHAIVPVTSDASCYGIYCAGGNSIIISDCYLENINTLINVSGAKNISIKDSYINLLAQSTIGCILTSGEKFAMNNCYFKSSYSNAIAVSVGSSFDGLVDLTGNVFDVDSGNIYQGNILKVLYNDENAYFTQIRHAVKTIDSSVTNITEVGNYISTGDVTITLTISSITITGGVINLYVNSGTLTLTVPYVYGSTGTRTYTLTGGMGCSIIKNPNGYYSVMGATPN